MPDIKLNSNDILFHGTMEEFDPKNIRPGGYDGIFWTTDSSTIAQTYIPIAGISSTVDSRSLRSPNTEFAHQLGLKFEDVEVKGGNVVSYRDLNRYFNEIDDKKNNLIQEMIKWEKIDKELGNQLNELSKKLIEQNIRPRKSEEFQKLSEQYEEAYDKYLDVESEYQSFNDEKLKNQYINEKMIEMGHRPSEKFHNDNYRWEIKIGRDSEGRSTILPPDFKEKGRLFVISPKREMKIYDISTGESDLTDLQYHKLDLFKELEKKGYDGVKIDDFAQHDKYGNVGHSSIGFFKSSIKDLDMNVIDNVTHPDNLEHHSDEYKNSLNEAVKFFNFLDKFNSKDSSLIESIKEGYLYQVEQKTHRSLADGMNANNIFTNYKHIM
jgi:hypothetical protein